MRTNNPQDKEAVIIAVSSIKDERQLDLLAETAPQGERMPAKEVMAKIHEQFLAGETHRTLAQRYGVPLGIIRRVSRQEGWKRERDRICCGETAAAERVGEHLRITARLLDIAQAALASDSEMYTYIEVLKSGGWEVERLSVLNEVRFARMVKLIADIIALEREALGIPQFKEQSDARLGRDKLERDREISLRKLELELMKLENGATGEGGGVSTRLIDALTCAGEMAESEHFDEENDDDF